MQEDYILIKFEAKMQRLGEPADNFLEAVRVALKRPILQHHRADSSYLLSTPYDAEQAQLTSYENKFHDEDSNESSRDSKLLETLDIVRRSFRHVHANPSKKTNRMAWSNLYVYPEKISPQFYYDLGLTPDDVDCINLSEKQVKSWMKRISSELDGFSEKLKIEKNGALPPSCFLLGWRGSGKTTFQNFAFTKYGNILHENKIIWIRIDLTAPGHDRFDLSDWLDRQICRVIIKYYSTFALEQESEKREDCRDDALWLEKIENDLVFDFSDTKKLLSDLERKTERDVLEPIIRQFISRVYFENDTDEPLIPEKWFSEIVKNELNRQNCRILVVVDGLDQLGLTDDSINLFDKRIQMIKKWINTRNNFPTYYVITMRPESYKKFCQSSARDNGQRSPLYAIEMAQSYKIWQKKLYRLKDLVDAHNEHHQDRFISYEYAEILSWCYIVFVSYSMKIAGIDPASIEAEGGDRFIEHSLNRFIEGDDENIVESVFSVIDRIFFPDYRRLFESLAEALHFMMLRIPDRFFKELDNVILASNSEFSRSRELIETVARDFQRYRYVVVDALLLESGARGLFRYNNWYLPRYQFRVHIDKSAESENISFSYENNKRIGFISNIYQFPFVRQRKWRLMPLAQIRILQLLGMFGVHGVSQSVVVQFLSDRFRYYTNVLRPLLLMMKHIGMIRDISFKNGYTGDEVRITDKGSFFLNRMSCALEYVSLVLHDVPLPVDLVKHPATEKIGWFPIRPYHSSEFPALNKFLATTSFVRCICDIEEAESVSFDREGPAELLGKSGKFDDFDEKGFRFAHRLSDGVYKGIRSSSRRVFDERDKEMDQLLKEIEEKLRG